MATKHSPEYIQHLIALFESGKSYTEIAALERRGGVDITRNSIAALLARNGVKRDPAQRLRAARGEGEHIALKLPAAMRRQIIAQAVAEGKTQAEVASALIWMGIEVYRDEYGWPSKAA